MTAKKEVTINTFHRLSSVDVLFETAVCSTCGSTDIYVRGGKWVCVARKEVEMRNDRRRRYNLTELELEIFDATKVCDLCKNPFKSSHDKVVDHEHTANRFRGVLCRTCNVLLGMAKDSTETLAKAILYLEKYREC